MDIIKGDGKILKNMNLDPKNTYEEVLQNCAIILATVQKSCPMLRNMGIPGDLKSRPIEQVENELVAHVYDQIEEYEPRAILGDVRFEKDYKTGMINVIVELEGVDEDA